MLTKNTKKNAKFWFAVRANFTCPTCKKLSTEVLYTSAGRPDPDRIAAAIQTQDMVCQICKIRPADGTQIALNVLPVTLEQALAAGFKPPPGASL